MLITNIKQLQDGLVYYKQNGSFGVVSDLHAIPDGSLLYIRNGSQVMMYKENSLFPTQSINVGFNITNPWAGNVTQADIDKIIVASKKLAVNIQKGIEASKKMQNAEEKAFMRTVYEGFAIVLIAAITIGVIAYLAPATTAAASGGTAAESSSSAVGLSTGAQYAGIAGAPSAIGAPVTSTLFASGGSVLPSAGAGVGLISTGGGVILPSASIATAATTTKTLSTLSKIGKSLGISSVQKTAVTAATTAGKFLMSKQQTAQAQKAMQTYQQAVANRNAQQANAIKQYYQNQLTQWENQLSQQRSKGKFTSSPIVGSTLTIPKGSLWGATSTTTLDLKEYLPYIIGGVALLFVITKHK